MRQDGGPVPIQFRRALRFMRREQFQLSGRRVRSKDPDKNQDVQEPTHLHLNSLPHFAREAGSGSCYSRPELIPVPLFNAIIAIVISDPFCDGRKLH
ncbi:MAG TPA: hypothetical protein VGS10_22335 [Terracidiphilus sp.]|nr:hypothetical protein [Terracidiphilus sp.]